MMANGSVRVKATRRIKDRCRFLAGVRARACLAGLVLAGVADAASLMLTNGETLSFGAVVAGPAGGTVTIGSSGIRSCSAGVTCLPRSLTAAARFNVSGDPLMTYAITLPSSAVLADGAGHTMTVDDFAADVASTALDAAGAGSFAVGATLHIAPGQPMGAYAGTFDVIVEYD